MILCWGGVAGGEQVRQHLYACLHGLLHLGAAAGAEQGAQLRTRLSTLTRHHLVQPVRSGYKL